MNIWVALAIIGVVMAGILVAAFILYQSTEAKRRSDSAKSLPEGGDTSYTARMLQDKYRAERDSGDFKRPDFL